KTPLSSRHSNKLPSPLWLAFVGVAWIGFVPCQASQVDNAADAARMAAQANLSFEQAAGPETQYVVGFNRDQRRPWISLQERTRGAQIPWFVYGYGLSGFLHWGANSWMSDPFKQSVVPTGSGDQTKNFLPAGDTHILYPGDNGPWISLRRETRLQAFSRHESGTARWSLLLGGAS
ncbi:MAG: DUF4091 domain-containing protein, partial [Spartobacteria bacterium]